jgi:hypothetical protein
VGEGNGGQRLGRWGRLHKGEGVRGRAARVKGRLVGRTEIYGPTRSHDSS